MKKVLSIVLCMAMLMSSLSFCLPAVAIELDFGVESAENYAQTTEEPLQADLMGGPYTKSNGEPGLNILTGTTAGLDFEKSAIGDFVTYANNLAGTTVTLATKGTTANAANVAVKIAAHSDNQWFDVTPFALNNTATVTEAKAKIDGPSLPVLLDLDRTYTVSFDYIAQGEVIFINTAATYQDADGRNYELRRDTLNSEEWATYSHNFNGSEFSHDGTQAKPQKLFLTRRANRGTGDYYFDNISIVPNYKITYNYNDGTGTTVVKYALPEAVNGVRTLTPNAEVAPERTGYKFLGWATTADGEVVSEVALANADVELFAVWKEKASYTASNGEPGLNILTGTTAPLDFDKSETEDFWVSNSEIAVYEGTNKAFKMPVDSYNQLSFIPYALNLDGTGTVGSYVPSLPVDLDEGRPIELSFEYIADGRVRFVNTAHKTDGDFYIKDLNTAATDWTAYSTQIAYDKLTSPSYGYQALVVMRHQSGNGSNPYWFDNVSMVPYYKVTYIDGETETSEYILPEADAQGVRVFAPTATLKNVRGSKFLGWSTDPNATTAMSEITLGNKDITLYAVWETKWTAPGKNVLTGTTDAIDFENAETADFWVSNAEITVKATEENDANKAMMTGTNNGHFNITPSANNWLVGNVVANGASLPSAIEEGRPATISMNYIADKEFRLTSVPAALYDVNGHTCIFHMETHDTLGEWGEFSYTFSGSDLYSKDTDLVQQILVGQVNGASSNNYYFDNIKVVPHYQVTYVHNDGTEDTTVVYALPSADKETGIRTLTPDEAIVPTREGYVLAGWSTEADGEVVEAVELAYEDVQLYAVWEKCEAITLNTASIRTNNNQGIRYAGYVSKSMRDIANVEEYGYIVAAEYKFDNGDYSELKFNANGDVTGKLDNVAANYASAAAYTKGGRDYSELLTVEQAKEQARFSDAVLSGIDEIGYYFSAVVTNIPEEHYNDKLVGKTYIKVNGSYYYGEAIAMSIYEVAVAYKAKYEAEGISVPQYILDVINAVEDTANN